MQVSYQFNIKEGRTSEFVQWVRDNEETMVDHAPDGWTYVGTWFTVQGFGDYDTEQRWEIEDYGSLGTGFGDEEFQRLIVESADFLQPHPQATTLMKSATDVTALAGM